MNASRLIPDHTQSKALEFKILCWCLGLSEFGPHRGGVGWGGEGPGDRAQSSKVPKSERSMSTSGLWDSRTSGPAGWVLRRRGPKLQSSTVRKFKVELWTLGPFRALGLSTWVLGRQGPKLQRSKVRKFWVNLRTFWTSRTLGLSGRVLRVGPKTPKAHSSKIQGRTLGLSNFGPFGLGQGWRAQHWPQSSKYQGPTFGLWDFRTVCPSG